MSQDDKTIVRELKDYVDQRISEHLVMHKLLAEALTLARESNEKALELTRMALASESGTKFVAKDEFVKEALRIEEKYNLRFGALERLLYVGVGIVLVAGALSGLIIYLLTGKRG